MAAFELREIFLPFCLQRTADGGYLVLNRKYKPLGVMCREWVDYDAHPSKFRFKQALSAKQIAALSFNGSVDADCIRLYDEGSSPTISEANWQAFSARLQRLAAYDIEG